MFVFVFVFGLAAAGGSCVPRVGVLAWDVPRVHVCSGRYGGPRIVRACIADVAVTAASAASRDLHN